MMRAKAAGLALAASFSVYLIPIIGPHAAWFVGELLFSSPARKAPGWNAVNAAVAVATQVVAFACFYWVFRRPDRRRILPLFLIFPLLWSVLQRAYMAWIPTRFLEEPDIAKENLAWPLSCTAPDVFQTNLNTPSELWVRYSQPENQYAVLTMPGCKLQTIPLPQPTLSPGGRVDFMIAVTNVMPGGRALVEKTETRGGKVSWLLTPGRVLEPPAGHTGRAQPILSNDARWVAWLEDIPNTGPPVLSRVILRPLEPGEMEQIVDLSAIGPATYFLKNVDMKAKELTLWKTDHLVTVGFDGKSKKESIRPRSISAQAPTYLISGKYWLAWDAYRDEERYSLAWSLPFGSGSHQVPLGRTIHSAAFDTSGKWIAVSVGTSLNIGKALDAVYVLSAADGREVFRKYLPPYTRSPVALLDGGFLAYSDLAGVRVLRMGD